MQDEKVKLIAFNNVTWELMKFNIKDIGQFLSDHEQVPGMSHLILMSVKLVLSELFIRKEHYGKNYPFITYSEEDFVDMVIDSMVVKLPDLDDEAANKDFMEDIRNTIWGHIKTRVLRLSDIMKAMLEDHDTELSGNDVSIFMECLTVVWVECLLRDREAYILERIYDV